MVSVNGENRLFFPFAIFCNFSLPVSLLETFPFIILAIAVFLQASRRHGYVKKGLKYIAILIDMDTADSFSMAK